MTAKEMRELRAGLASKIKELAAKARDEKREFTAEENEQWTKLNADYDSQTKQMEVAERADRIDAEQAARTETATAGREDYDGRTAAQAVETAVVAPPTEAERSEAIRGWMNAQLGREVAENQRTAAKRCGLRLDAREVEIRLGPVHKRDLTVTTTAGGYLIPTGFVPSLEQAMATNGNVQQVAEVIRTGSGNPLQWPTAIDTSNTGALLAINTTIGTSTDPTIGQFLLDAYKFSSKLILVPPELLEDSAIDVPSILGDMLGTRLGKITNSYYTTGTGNGQPNGIVTASTAGKTAAATSAIDLDELLDLIHSVDPAYRTGAAFMCHDNVVLALRKIATGEGDYYWQPSIQVGAPDRLFGYPVYVNQAMASVITNSAKTVLFGDLSKYKIREVGSIRLRRLVERYADTDQEGFVAFLRADGDLLNAGGNPVKHLIQKA